MNHILIGTYLPPMSSNVRDLVAIHSKHAPTRGLISTNLDDIGTTARSIGPCHPFGSHKLQAAVPLARAICLHWLGTGRPSILDRLDDPCFCCLLRAAPESKEGPRLVLVVPLPPLAPWDHCFFCAVQVARPRSSARPIVLYISACCRLSAWV